MTRKEIKSTSMSKDKRTGPNCSGDYSKHLKSFIVLVSSSVPSVLYFVPLFSDTSAFHIGRNHQV